jgi:hypothetical protein
MAAEPMATPHRFRMLPSEEARRCILCKGAGSDAYGVCVLCDGACFHTEDELEVERVELWSGSGDAAFLLRNLLTAEECNDLIAQAESFGLADSGYSSDIRITDRVSVMGDDLSSLLFDRARPFLQDVVVPIDGVVPQGVNFSMGRGRWQPVGLNPCLRGCRYRPGGFFCPHFDGGFDMSQRVRSIKTFMLYLNEDFEGGRTRFYNESQPRYRGGEPENEICALRPETGSCLVFNHRITHDGEELLAGVKYILRTEVMYERQQL